MFAQFFDINNIFFTFLNYPMSYLEFFGTIFTAWSVYLAAKNKIITWPIGLLGVVLYGFLFYQIQLYSDLIEQFYYLVTGFWGWWLWSHPDKKDDLAPDNQRKISFTSKKENIIYGAIIFVGTLGLGYFISKVHLILPQAFYLQASYPYIDAGTTIMSFVANYLLMKRKIESWYLWIIVDIFGVWLYLVKGTVFLSMLYFAFLINAIFGYLKWRKETLSYEKV